MAEPAVDSTVRLDVWGGPLSADHLARFHFGTPAEAFARAEVEINANYIVELRPLGDGESWGRPEDFERRRYPPISARNGSAGRG